jgi:integrase
MAAKSVRAAAVLGGVIEKRSEDGKCYYDRQIVTRFYFHNFRHGLATWLAEQGTDSVQITRMLRQSTSSMAMHYVHGQKRAREAQAQLINELGVVSPDSGSPLQVQ